MVAKVITGKSITALIGYNERKCQRGVAQCLLASGFLKDETRLSRLEKVARFTRLTARNQRTKTNALHVPISFSPEEKLSRETLSAVASAYMNKIGFGEQPYLVYLHSDTKLQHLHIVSTLIQEDGSRIRVHNLGRNQSARARRELEQEFGLVNADTRGKLRRVLDEPRKKAVKRLVDKVISEPSVRSVEDLMDALKVRGVRVQLHSNEDGRTFGVTFHDEKAKVSFKGSELGKGYSINAIIKRIEGRSEALGSDQMWSSIHFASPDQPKGNDVNKGEVPSQILEHLIDDRRVGASPESTLRLAKRRKKRKKRRRI